MNENMGCDYPMALAGDEEVTLQPNGSGFIRDVVYVAGLAAGSALAYHGYKRNESVGWALVWGIFGGMVWPLALPIAFAQGFGEKAR